MNKQINDRLCACGCKNPITHFNQKTVYLPGHCVRKSHITDEQRAKRNAKLDKAKLKAAQNPRPCACGCGGEVISVNKQTRYIGHHAHRGKGMSESHKKSVRNANLGSKRTPEQLQKLSKSKVKSWADGVYDRTVLYPWRGTPTLYKDVTFRSKLEARVAYLMDHHSVSWLYEPVRFILDGFTYLPDFYLPEFDCYIEVKPDENGPRLEKTVALRDAGYKVITVFSKEVREIEKLVPRLFKN